LDIPERLGTRPSRRVAAWRAAPYAEHLRVRVLDVRRELAFPATMRDLDEPAVELEGRAACEDRLGGDAGARQWGRHRERDRDAGEPVAEPADLCLAGLR